MRYKNILLVNAEPVKNFGNIKYYLIKNTDNLITFHYSPGYSNQYSYFEKYSKGKLEYRRELNIYKGSNNLIKYIFYYIYYNYIIFKFLNRNAYIVNLSNPLFCIFNFFPKLIRNVQLVLIIGDYFPANSFLMKIYDLLVDYYNRSLKYVLYLSPPIQKVYSGKYNIKSKTDKIRKLVTLGIKMSYKHNRLSKVGGRDFALGFIGIIREQQGLDLAFEFLKINNDCRLEIIGKGYRMEYYQKLAKKLNIANKVKFYGFVDKPEDIFSKWDAGIALYENKVSNLSRYCEPTKIKDYLSYGLPVITTSTTYFHKEIEHYKAGLVIKENVASLRKAVDEIKNNYSEYVSGVDKIVSDYEYSKWYEKRFEFLE
jgi:glycosyltransferase involved in cell wall biosynthesis